MTVGGGERVSDGSVLRFLRTLLLLLGLLASGGLEFSHISGVPCIVRL